MLRMSVGAVLADRHLCGLYPVQLSGLDSGRHGRHVRHSDGILLHEHEADLEGHHDAGNVLWGCLRAQWYPFPFFLVLGSLIR